MVTVKKSHVLPTATYLYGESMDSYEESGRFYSLYKQYSYDFVCDSIERKLEEK